MVKLKNKLRQARVFNLEHDRYCTDGKCACTDTVFDGVEPNYATGEHAYVRRPKRINATLRLTDREVKSGLRNTVLKCREIAGAIRLGNIQVLEQTTEEQVPGKRADSSTQGQGSSKSKKNRKSMSAKSDEPAGE